MQQRMRDDLLEKSELPILEEKIFNLKWYETMTIIVSFNQSLRYLSFFCPILYAHMRTNSEIELATAESVRIDVEVTAEHNYSD